ncbi:MAG: radical SAM protein [Chloroflexi bacterium]|nr:radical SAM protein [Chloroflexota bacterium]MCL5025997.1 radical SAM protein [Chloroflexota bacterium]
MDLPKSKLEFLVRSAQFACRLPFLYASFNRDRPLHVSPLSVDVNITDRCNFACLMCRGANPGYKPKPELSIDVMKRVIDDMKQMRIPYLTLTGGEPTLRLGFILETLQHSRARGIAVGMVSNGSLLDEQEMTDLVRSGLHRIAFSLDGATEEVHDSIRMPGSYSKVIASLAMCQCVKKQSRYNFRVHVNTVVVRPNVRQLVEIARIARSFGAVSLFQPVDVGQAEHQVGSDPVTSASVRSLMVGEREIPVLENAVSELLALQRRDAVVANLTWQLRNIVSYYRRLASGQDSFRFRCYTGFNTIHIDSDGKFGSCIFLPPAGDLNAATLKEAWDSPAYTLHRETIRKCSRPCSLNCYYPMSLGMLAYNFGYLPVRRKIVNALAKVPA